MPSKIASYGYKLPEVSFKVLDVTFVPLDDVLTPKQLEITTSELDVLLDKLQKGEWKAVEVTDAFCHRAVIAHYLINCLNEAPSKRHRRGRGSSTRSSRLPAPSVLSSTFFVCVCP
ncbi:hypothetical protein JCM8547_007456 [Rhodosporidiobolus lusitaniae]